MVKMGFGIYYTGEHEPAGPTPFAQRVEDLGFDGLWVGEAPTNRAPVGSPMSDTFTTMCFAAAATSRITIGSNVILLPLHHPAWVAMRWGTLDVLSKGRSILGIGAGGEYPKQFEAFGAKVENRGKQTDECIEVIKNLWTEPESSYKGRFFQFDGIIMGKPFNKPHPPIWVGGRPGGIELDPQGKPRYKSKTGAMKRAAKYGDAWCPYYMTVETYRNSKDQVKSYAKELGRDISKIVWALYTHIWIRDNYEEALQAAAGKIRYGRDLAKKIEGYDILGTPKEIIPRIEKYAEAGVDYLILNVHAPPGQVYENLKVMAEEIVPHFR